MPSRRRPQSLSDWCSARIAELVAGVPISRHQAFRRRRYARVSWPAVELLEERVLLSVVGGDIIVVDHGVDALLKIDPATGERTILSIGSSVINPAAGRSVLLQISVRVFFRLPC